MYRIFFFSSFFFGRGGGKLSYNAAVSRVRGGLVRSKGKLGASCCSLTSMFTHREW